jgi:hypothetical protein
MAACLPGYMTPCRRVIFNARREKKKLHSQLCTGFINLAHPSIFMGQEKVIQVGGCG